MAARRLIHCLGEYYVGLGIKSRMDRFGRPCMPRWLIIPVLCGVLTSGVGAQVSSTADDFLIERHRVGKVAIDAPAQGVYERFGSADIRLVDRRLEGMLSPALVIARSKTVR